MSRHLGAHLPADLRSRLQQENATSATRAIVICTIDSHGHSHPAMLSVQEVFAVDDTTVRLATYAASRTATNLRERRHVTAILADVDGVFYIKGVASEPLAEDRRMTFDIRVVEVLEDTPMQGERALITSGIRFTRLAE